MLCSTCKKEEAKEGQRVCRPCHTLYMRNWREIVEKRSLRQARRDGALGFRSRAVELFQGMIDREMNGLTAAAIIEDLEV